MVQSLVKLRAQGKGKQVKFKDASNDALSATNKVTPSAPSDGSLKVQHSQSSNKPSVSDLLPPISKPRPIKPEEILKVSEPDIETGTTVTSKQKRQARREEDGNDDLM